MSSSLSNDERAERIAVIADIERRADYGSGNLTGHVNWLCTELRSALQREAEATKDAVQFTRADALRVRGAAQFAVDMSGGRANSSAVAALRGIADRIEKSALPSREE